MGNAIIANRPKTGITKDDFVDVLGRRISIKRRRRIRSQQRTHFRQFPDKGFGQTLCFLQNLLFRTGRTHRVGKTQPCVNLLRKQCIKRPDMHACMETNGLLADSRVPVITGEKNRPTQMDNIFQHLARWQSLFISTCMKQLFIRLLVRKPVYDFVQCLAMLLPSHLSNYVLCGNKCKHKLKNENRKREIICFLTILGIIKSRLGLSKPKAAFILINK